MLMIPSRTRTSISGRRIPVLAALALFIWVLGLWVPASPRAETQTVSGQTAQDVIDQSRVLLNAVSDTKWTDAQLLRHLNDGIVNLVAKTNCLQSVETKSVTTGATTFSITSEYSRIAGAIYTSGATSYQKALIRASMFDQRLGMGGEVSGTVTGEPSYFDDWNNTLYAWPPAAASSGSILVFLVDKPSNLALASALTTPFIYDQALAYYVCWHALLRDRRYTAASSHFKVLYDAELLNYRGDYLAVQAALKPAATTGGK